MKTMWDIVDKHFDPVYVLSPAGHRLVQTYSLKAAHHELPYVMHFLAIMCSLVNGAKSQWFPNSSSPMFLMVLNVNYTQTRKSSLTGNGDNFGDQLDAFVKAVVSAKADQARQQRGVRARGGDDAEDSAVRSRRRSRSDAEDAPLARPEVVSSVLHSATPTEFFHRCAGDFQQVKNADAFPDADLSGRHNFGILVNLDEAYDMLVAFGLIDDGKAVSKGKTVVNPFQSAFNKLAQYGQASRATKTSGSYGQAAAPTISAGLTGNMQHSTYMPMERGESGSHHVAAKERILISTGRPIQPHAPLPEDYEMPEGHPRWNWVPLVPDVAAVLQFEVGAASPEQAAKVWSRAKAPTEEAPAAECEQIGGKVYVPDAEGFEVKLPDGVATQVRFRRAPNMPNGFRAEWRTANRSFPMPPEHTLEVCVPRVTAYFAQPHLELKPSEEALAMHQSYQGAFNVKSQLERESGEVHSGAALGAAPWHLGEIASCLWVFDIFHGRYEDTDEYRDGNIHVE